MSYRTYVCDDCGFSSEEEPGVYLCPKCNNKMRISKTNGVYGGGGDTTSTDGKILIYMLLCVFVLPLLFAFLNIFGVIIFIVIFYFVRKGFNNSIRNKAIPVNNSKVISSNNEEKPLFCQNCGHKLVDNAKFCPNCGEEVLLK